ncbi:MAG TPA: hypothetical protein VN612_00460 [Acidobacteriaceae bacterium]|nr:hypothetical protein [Acidobacteriaceae bacterium]
MKLRRTSPLQRSILIALGVCLTLSSRAQQPPRDHDPNAMDTTTTEATAPAPEMTPEQIALMDRYLTNVNAKVAGKIDTKNAAAGQGIVLEVTEDAKLANGTELPKGTKLTGHVVRAKSYEKDASAAVLSINIDRAVLRDGKVVPIRCALRTVTSAASLKSNLSDPSQPRRRGRSSGGGGPMGGGAGLPSINDPMGGIGTDTPVIGADSSGIGGMGGGGIGGAGSPVGGPGSANGYPGGTSTTRNGSITGNGSSRGSIGTGDPGIGGSPTTVGDRTRDALGTTTAVGAAAPVEPVATGGIDLHDAPRRTGLPGVMLSGASIAGISGTLSAFQSNISLDSSTQVTLGVISR